MPTDVLEALPGERAAVVLGEAGGTVRLDVDPAHVHLFDPDTTDRLP